MVIVYEKSCKGGALNIGLNQLNVLSRMRLSLPMRIPFTKGYRIIKVCKLQFGDYISRTWGFSRIYGVKDMIVIQYNKSSIFYDIVNTSYNTSYTK